MEGLIKAKDRRGGWENKLPIEQTFSEYATVEGVVAKVFTQQKRQHIPEYWSHLSQPDIHRLDPAGIASEQIARAIIIKTHGNFVGRLTTKNYTFASATFHRFLP